jgi:hypothetical protein
MTKLREVDIEGVVIETLRINGYTVWKLGGKRPVDRVFKAILSLLGGMGYFIPPVKQTELRKGINLAFNGMGENSVGAPDLLIYHPAWPLRVLFGLEVKGPTTVISEDQKALSAIGAYPIGRGIYECLDHLQNFEAQIQATMPTRVVTNIESVKKLYL